MIKLNKNYSDYTDETDNKYPLGKAINSSGSDSYDGTPILADLVNDLNAAHIAMYEKAYGGTDGITGRPDTQKDSQFANAVAKYTDDAVSGHSGKTGVDAHGATSEATPNQIVCRNEDGRTKVAAPVENLDAVNKGYVEKIKENLENEIQKNATDIANIINDGTEDTSHAWSGAKIAEEIETDFKNIYSLEETIIGYWIDGRPIYRKVVVTTKNGEMQIWGFVSDEAAPPVDRLIKTYFISATTPYSRCVYGRVTNGKWELLDILSGFTPGEYVVYEYTKITD